MKKDEAEMARYAGRPVVRLFSGYAESPIWFAGGPVDYADSGLTKELVTDLSAWDSSSYGGDGLLMEKSERATALSEELAARLAAELGDGFVVSQDGAAGPKMVSSEMPPTNPDAAAAFTSIIDEELKLQEPGPGGMEHHAPLSGRVLEGPNTHRNEQGPEDS
ncbi:hypothetical protein [Arthrobacter sp. TMN-50]